MRLIALILAVFVVVSPAAAQTWKEYNYPADSFGVSFPAEPKVESTMYQAANSMAKLAEQGGGGGAGNSAMGMGMGAGFGMMMPGLIGQAMQARPQVPGAVPPVISPPAAAVTERGQDGRGWRQPSRPGSRPPSGPE